MSRGRTHETDAFHTTRWTLVHDARGESPEARQALGELCAGYYEPVVTFLRSRCRNDDSARELAHAFFARVLAAGSLGGADAARGHFRSYLLGAVKHFLSDESDRASAEKRGGDAERTTIDSATTIPAPDARQTELAFDRQWALTVIARGLEVVATELRAAGKAAHFEALKPWLTGENATLSQAEIARTLRVSEGAAKVAIHRLRQRFREAVKAEIAQTVRDASSVNDELRHLLAVLAAS
jgi:DNA-directed RNA polymerase specialized sigma24 family protein